MTRFIAQLNDGSYINILADKMKMEDNMILAYQDGCLVALADVSIILSAHLSERTVALCMN